MEFHKQLFDDDLNIFIEKHQSKNALKEQDVLPNLTQIVMVAFRNPANG